MAKQTVTLSVNPIIFSFLLLSVICLSVPVQAAPRVVIVSHTSYIGEWGYFTVVGEVHNVGDQTATNVGISATYYNAANEVLGTHHPGHSDVPLHMLLPGRKSPFSFVFLEATNASEVDHVSLSVDFSPTDVSLPLKLAITSHSSSIVDGHFIIDGEVENTADSKATLVKVIATYYDEDGRVVRMRGQSNMKIESNKKSAFQLDVSGVNVDLIDSYRLTTQSPFYINIPEFNAYLLTFLTVIMVPISLLLHKRKYSSVQVLVG